jgi:hypothetical protein
VSEEEQEKQKKKVKIESNKDEIPVEDIKEILNVVGTEIPTIIKGLFSSLYDAKTAEQYAEGIGIIYKRLTEQGLPQEMVEKLVMRYSDSINILGKAMEGIDFGSNKVEGKKKEEEEEEEE